MHAGTSIAQGFTSYHLDDFDITPYEHGEYRWGLTSATPHKHVTPSSMVIVPGQQNFGGAPKLMPASIKNTAVCGFAWFDYLPSCTLGRQALPSLLCTRPWCCCRIELFKPPYILGPRPAWASVPNQMEYSSTFTVILAANTSVADIVSVVLLEPGTTTHSLTMGMRTMQLRFASAGGQALFVTAPANVHVAQPGFYLLFAVARDDSYSTGAWMRLKGPWGSVPFSLPPFTQFVAAASSQFEVVYGEEAPRQGCECVGVIGWYGSAGRQMASYAVGSSLG